VWSGIEETGDDRKQLESGVFQMWKKRTQVQEVSTMKKGGEERS